MASEDSYYPEDGPRPVSPPYSNDGRGYFDQDPGIQGYDEPGNISGAGNGIEEPPQSDNEEKEKKSKLKGLFSKKSKKKEKKGKENNEEETKPAGDEYQNNPDDQSENTPKESKKKMKLGFLKKNKNKDQEKVDEPVGPDQSATLEKPVETSTPPKEYSASPQYPPPVTQAPPSYAVHNEYQTQSKQPSFSYYLKRPPKSYAGSEDIAELKPPKKKSVARCSVLIIVILISFFVLGIIFCASSSKGEFFAVLGPCMIALSLIALVGKVFLTLLWNEEMHPVFEPLNEKYKEYMMKGPNYQPEQASETTVYPAYNPITGTIVQPTVQAVPYVQELQYDAPVSTFDNEPIPASRHHVTFDPSFDVTDPSHV